MPGTPRCSQVFRRNAARSKLAPTEPAAIGHPWPAAANPASMPGCPLRRTCARPHGAYTATASEAAYRPACLRGSFVCDVPAPVRPPSRASSLPQGIGYTCERLDGEQAAFASRLAPTEEQKQSSPHRAASHHSSGRALARLQLLILIHPPPRQAEWRCSSGDGRAAPFDAVELIACRSKRSRPEGNAPG